MDKNCENELSVIQKAKQLISLSCYVQIIDIDIGKKTIGIIQNKIKELSFNILKFLLNADECSLTYLNESEIRRQYQREVIVSCKVLEALIDEILKSEDLKNDAYIENLGTLKNLAEDIKKMTAKWKNNDKKLLNKNISSTGGV